MFNINKNSITFKTISMFFISFSLFIIFIVLSVDYIFTKSYKNLIMEKISIIEKNINPSLALNLSYQFNTAVNEIGKKAILNNDVLLVQIESTSLVKPLIFTKDIFNIKEYKNRGEFISKTVLTDPTTELSIGYMTIVYSKKSYDELMYDFYTLLSYGLIFFISSITILLYFLYKSLKPLTDLAISLENFNPYSPRKLPCKNDIPRKDEIGSIKISANIMIDNILTFIENEQKMRVEIKKKEAHLRDAQAIAKVGSWEYNISTKKLKLSDEMYKILMLNKTEELKWTDFLHYIVNSDYNIVLNAIEKAIKENLEFNIKYSIQLDNQRIIHVQTKGHINNSVVTNPVITAVTLDITQDVRNQEMIEKLAYYDSLTGVANRLLLKDRIKKALQQAKRNENKLAIMFLDLDHFKLINDTLGHEIGDKLLIHVSQLLENLIRESDTLARIGGDEFVILFPIVNSTNDVENIAKKILSTLQEKHDIDGHKLFVTTSVGISMFPDNSKDVENLIKDADTAMYEAKNSGRNSYALYTESMGNHISKQLELEQDLAEAIKNPEQIQVYYQPKIFAMDNSIYGAEALVRWHHPTKGIIYPDQFIHIAESTGMMIELGNIITKKAIAQTKKWHNDGYTSLKIAINLSSRQFQDSNLSNFIKETIEEYSIDPNNLEFEITESLSMSNLDDTLQTLQTLKNIGLSISIDDFGTGHSSLAYLKKFPLDTLKVDRSFVMDIVEDEEDRVIVETIINMAHSLGLKVVAEGVEEIEHIELLKEMKCDLFQGYYYSKPITSLEFTNYLNNYKS